MKVISIVSAHPGSGQTTIVVNLAAGLLRKGYRVSVVDLGANQKLQQWLSLLPNQAKIISATDSAGAGQARGMGTQPGIDWMSCSSDSAGDCPQLADRLESLVGKYDFILLHPQNRQSSRLLKRRPDAILVCTDLKLDNELEALQKMERCWQEIDANVDPITLIVPNKINTKEWERNTRQLFDLAEYFGFEKIADPIPHCERVHDLPLDGRTVWELRQENLREAFQRLVDLVEGLGSSDPLS